jgi:hypothetical protein
MRRLTVSSRFGDLPVAVQLFFGAHDKDAVLLAHVFAPDAVVIERGRLFKGVASIAAWHRDFDARHPGHGFEARRIARSGTMRIRASMVVRGIFPASPLELLFAISMREHRIAELVVSDVVAKGRRGLPHA